MSGGGEHDDVVATVATADEIDLEFESSFSFFCLLNLNWPASKSLSHGPGPCGG